MWLAFAFFKGLLLAMCFLLGNPAEGLTCYKCNSTADPSCLGGNPATTKTCTAWEQVPERNGCFSVLINGTDISKGCLVKEADSETLALSGDMLTCIINFARFEVKQGTCGKRKLSREAYDRFVNCRKRGIGIDQGSTNDDGVGVTELAICICNEGDLCNAHMDKMDPGGSQVKWADKLTDTGPGISQCKGEHGCQNQSGKGALRANLVPPIVALIIWLGFNFFH